LPKRRRASSDEANFLLAEEEAVRVQAAIEESLQNDVKRRLCGSLQETAAELKAQYPEETKDSFEPARRRSDSELTDFVRSREATPSLGPQPQPSPRASLELELPPTHEDAAAERAGDPEMYNYDGLADHEQLMMAIYASQGLDYAVVQNRAHRFLEDIALRPYDMGVKNVDEHGNTLLNQCFYLSLARGYLGHEASWPDTSELALRLKRAIEAAVLAQRPGWSAAGGGGIDGEAMAFADFLPLAMRSAASGVGDCGDVGDDAVGSFLTELAVCVLDSTAGHVEVYLGPKYQDLKERATMERNLVLLWYTPGHYQCLVCADGDATKVSMTYEDFKDVLTR